MCIGHYLWYSILSFIQFKFNSCFLTETSMGVSINAQESPSSEYVTAVKQYIISFGIKNYFNYYFIPE